MLSQKAKYAIRALLFLTSCKEEKPFKIREIAEALSIPAPFLSKIMQDLVSEEIVSSVKGPGGGFFLSAKNKKTPLLKIVELTDSLQSFESCGLGLQKCSERKPCPIHHEFQALREEMKQSLRNKTLGLLTEEILGGHTHLV